MVAPNDFERFAWVLEMAQKVCRATVVSSLFTGGGRLWRKFRRAFVYTLDSTSATVAEWVTNGFGIVASLDPYRVKWSLPLAPRPIMLGTTA